MWQEARKQEKKIRGIMIDYKKRAERRQAYYTKMRADPHQLIRLYGQKCKFHILTEASSNVVSNGDGQLMAWQGDPEVMIDRFDVRAHLDFIPESKPSIDDDKKTEEEGRMERKCNYERYRTLVQVDATGADEETYLKQLQLEEEYGKKQAELQQANKEKKQLSKAKIHYEYEGSSVVSDKQDESVDDGSSSESELSDIDISIDVLELSDEQKAHLDALAMQYGIGYGQYCRQLLLEKKEFEYVKRLEEEEEERSKMPGRKGKSARRTLRAKQKSMRAASFSFAVKEEIPVDEKPEDSESESSDSSDTEEGNGAIEFITEFGGDGKKTDDKNDKQTSRSHKSDDRNTGDSSSRKRSKYSRSYSRTHHRSSRSKHRSRSRDRSRRSRDRSSSRSSRYDRHKRRSRTHSRSISPKGHKSRSEHSRSPTTKYKSIRSRSRSPSSKHRSGRSHSRSPSTKHKSGRSQSRSPSTKHRSGRSHSRSPSTKQKSGRSRSRSPSTKQRSGRSRSRSPSTKNQRNDRRSRSRSKDTSRKSPPKTSVSSKLLNSTKGGNPSMVDKSKLTPREKMKLRMQKMLNKQIKTDKKIEQKKQIAKEQEMEERDLEIYEMSRMLRMREREKKLRRSISPKGRLPSYDATNFHYRSRSPTPDD